MTTPMQIQDIDCFKYIEEIIKDPTEASCVDTRPVDPTNPLEEKSRTPLYKSMWSDETSRIINKVDKICCCMLFTSFYWTRDCIQTFVTILICRQHWKLFWLSAINVRKTISRKKMRQMRTVLAPNPSAHAPGHQSCLKWDCMMALCSMKCCHFFTVFQLLFANANGMHFFLRLREHINTWDTAGKIDFKKVTEYWTFEQLAGTFSLLWCIMQKMYPFTVLHATTCSELWHWLVMGDSRNLPTHN